MDRVDYAAYAKIYDESSLPFCIIQTIRERGGEPRDIVFKYVNRACSSRIGAEPADMLGKSFSAVIGRLPDAAMVKLIDCEENAGRSGMAVELGSGWNGPVNIQYETLGGGIAACYITTATTSSWLSSNSEGLLGMLPEAVAIVEFTKDTVHVKQCNDWLLNFCGYASDERPLWERAGFYDRLCPEDAPMLARKIQEVRNGLDSVSFSCRLRHKNGSYKYVKFSGAVSSRTPEKITMYGVYSNIDGDDQLRGSFETMADQLYLYRTTENAGVFRIRLDEDFTLLYGNDRYYDMHGYTEQSIKERLGGRCARYIHPDDLKMVREAIAAARADGRRYAKWVMRVITGAGSTRYMQTALSFSEVAGEPVMEGTVIDVTEQMRVQERLEAARREIDGIIRSMPGGLVKYVYDGRRLKAIYCSEGFGAIMGKSVEEYKNEIEKNGWECNVYPGDLHLVRHALEECAAGARDVDIDYRMKHRDGHYVWVNVQAKRVSKGSPAEINAVFHNLSVSSELYQMLLNNTETIVMVGDLETREMLYANKAAADFAGRDPDEVTGKKCYEYMMHSETPCEFCNPAGLHTGVSTEVVLNGSCFDVRAEYIKWNGRDAYVEYVNDITNSWKIKNQLAIDREKLDTIINRITTGIAVYRLAADGKLRLEGCNDAFCELFHITMKDASSLDEEGVYTWLHPDDFDRAKDSFLSMFSVERRASFDFRAQIGGGYSWLSLSGISVAQPDGSSLAYVSYMDISKQKAAEEELSKNARLLASALAELRESHRQLEAAAKKAQLNFDEELKYQSETQSDDLLVKVRCNLTQDVVESYIARSSVGVSFAGMSYTDVIEALAATGYTEEERAMIRRMLNTERVLKSFQDGDSSYSMDYRRVAASGNVIWVNTTVKTYQDLRSGDVKSFMYTVDIDRKKVSEGIISTVAAVEHDFVMLIDLNSDEFYVYTGSDEATAVPPKFGRHYANAMRGLNAEWVAPEDAERAAADMTPERIRANLADGRAFSAVYRAVDKEGAQRHKKIEYFWLAGSSWQVILTRSDVTDLIMEQQRQQELLKNALCQAEQASRAKTDFLSKMSHEIRTPMNAIIGMNALAAQSLNDSERAANYISKAGLSSRYLLALINDILDMSRIESGKVNINSEKIPFEEFLRGINAICYGQASEKHISYDSIIHGFVADAYFGDAMKLQQILVNLLGNAVKFTPDGGKVQLIISQERIEHGSAYVKFTVNDTGVGISEPFQKVMFEPFEQEHSDITSPYGGTGLGLAITKNLVTLMGGTINVSSILGIGTEFSVTLPLGICEERPPCLPVSINLAGKRALVVDDEVLICQQMKDIFDELGMESEWAGSGVGAVEEVQRARESGLSYELIIIDWKMPEIDGVETARRIRSIVGDDVTIIIMTAYDVNEVESAAKEAGVNLVVTKPLFRSSLTAAFERIYLKKADRKLTAEPPADYDFSGKHILVVEDHPMNVEVARRLLEAKGADVEVAENGLIAIEIYAARPVGYFDAILMDIRMPVMDGLTATRSIRQMRKRTAKKIPIIAMSANAFDEDVERSLAAGMNAHLSKPIEPKTLYAALHSFINKSGL